LLLMLKYEVGEIPNADLLLGFIYILLSCKISSNNHYHGHGKMKPLEKVFCPGRRIPYNQK
jgi:hypothetical protein